MDSFSRKFLRKLNNASPLPTQKPKKSVESVSAKSGVTNGVSKLSPLVGRSLFPPQTNITKNDHKSDFLIHKKMTPPQFPRNVPDKPNKFPCKKSKSTQENSPPKKKKLSPKPTMAQLLRDKEIKRKSKLSAVSTFKPNVYVPKPAPTQPSTPVEAKKKVADKKPIINRTTASQIARDKAIQKKLEKINAPVPKTIKERIAGLFKKAVPNKKKEKKEDSNSVGDPNSKQNLRIIEEMRSKAEHAASLVKASMPVYNTASMDSLEEFLAVEKNSKLAERRPTGFVSGPVKDSETEDSEESDEEEDIFQPDKDLIELNKALEDIKANPTRQRSETRVSFGNEPVDIMERRLSPNYSVIKEKITKRRSTPVASPKSSSASITSVEDMKELQVDGPAAMKT